MRILLFNKMCTRDVKVYLEKKFSRENLRGPAVPEAAVTSVNLFCDSAGLQAQDKAPASLGFSTLPLLALVRVCVGLHHSPNFLVHICLSPASTFVWQSPVSSSGQLLCQAPRPYFLLVLGRKGFLQPRIASSCLCSQGWLSF